MGFDIATKKDQVLSLGEKKGKYSAAKILNFVRETKSYKEMRTMAGVNKQQMMHNICREMSNQLVKPMLKEVVSMYAEYVTELSQEIKRLNNEISGSDESAPKNEAEERYNSDIIQLTEHAAKVEKLGLLLTKCEKMAEKQNEKIFGSIDDANDDESFDSDAMDTLKTIKDHGKSIEKQIEDEKHALYTQASNGLHNKSIKSGTNDKAPAFPKGIADMKKKEFIARLKLYLEFRPDNFAYILPEARRSMDDLNRKNGVHFDPGTWDEQDEKIRDEFKKQNDRLFKMFELNLPQKSFTAAQAQYTFGLSGLVKTKGKCEKGDGLRVLHYFLSTLSKVSTAKIDEVETDLQCLPMKFGTGGVKQIMEAVIEAEELLERGDEMECVVQYKTVTQICQVLTKKNPLFVRLHQEYLKAPVMAERRNSIADLRRLMGDIKEVCEQICGGAGDDTRTVKVNMTLRNFDCEYVLPDSETSNRKRNFEQTPSKENLPYGQSVENRKCGGSGTEFVEQEKKRLQFGLNAMQENPECKGDKCTVKAFRHKKERGGQIHESGLCFDCFVEAVRDGKKDRPDGVKLKGGKKMIMKRGEDMKWNFRILSIQMEENDEGPIQKMLKRNRAEEGGEEERIFHTFIQNQGEVRKSTRNMVIESEGTFDLADLEEGNESDKEVCTNSQSSSQSHSYYNKE